MSGQVSMPIETAAAEELSQVRRLYASVTRHLRKRGIGQWDWIYPNRWVIRSDLRKGCLFAVRQGNLCIGAVAVDEEQSKPYGAPPWQDSAGRPACIHRLAVDPAYQGRGLGKRSLQHAEEHARSLGCSSIRLDVYTGNPAAVGMYERAGYIAVGLVRYPFRKLPYQCMEKIL
ncbi:GNAT family N-acetyltransferase [Paenibacillus sp. P25]|nr:GNAT family N-acetyltransferase [Paenibacillus sp. P25]